MSSEPTPDGQDPSQFKVPDSESKPGLFSHINRRIRGKGGKVVAIGLSAAAAASAKGLSDAPEASAKGSEPSQTEKSDPDRHPPLSSYSDEELFGDIPVDRGAIFDNTRHLVPDNPISSDARPGPSPEVTPMDLFEAKAAEADEKVIYAEEEMNRIEGPDYVDGATVPVTMKDEEGKVLDRIQGTYNAERKIVEAPAAGLTGAPFIERDGEEYLVSTSFDGEKLSFSLPPDVGPTDTGQSVEGSQPPPE